MSKKKGKSAPARRRKGRSIPGLKMAQYLAATAGLWGAAVLERLPHGFESLAQGKGKKPWANKRVLLLLVLTLWLLMSDKLKYRMWAIPAAALLTLAVTQHNATYGGAEEQAALLEVYE